MKLTSDDIARMKAAPEHQSNEEAKHKAVSRAARVRKLPQWSDCEAACDAGEATAVQKFIYEYEPADDEKRWRELLADALAEGLN